MSNSMQALFGEPIYVITRQNLIDDGDLIDVSSTKEAKEAGFKVPVALSRTVWDNYVEWSDSDSERKKCDQDQTGRLWDLLYMVHFAILQSKQDTDTIIAKFFVVPRDTKGFIPLEKEVKVHIGPGDQGEPVITILLPHED